MDLIYSTIAITKLVLKDNEQGCTHNHVFAQKIDVGEVFFQGLDVTSNELVNGVRKERENPLTMCVLS